MSDPKKEKLKSYMEADFLPTATGVAGDDRQRHALEYIAYHMGQIDKKLGQLIETLESLQKKA